ncbi:hypothetical protein [Haloterrigena salifodinae]|uniref:hypothetical protein n=1 Tax=Haloterrigena salifodinae TaxID=2675099 RepID=UPI000F8786E7|nr:hypothetical protein [Haloterrigena salifodinae]
MNRRWFAVLGAGFLIVPVSIIVALGTVPTKNAIVTAGFVLVPLSGILSVLGGLGVSRGNFEWYQFVGLSNDMFGFWFVAYAISSILADPSEFSSVFSLATVGLGCLSLALIGIDWLIGAPHFDIETYEG